MNGQVLGAEHAVISDLSIAEECVMWNVNRDSTDNNK